MLQAIEFVHQDRNYRAKVAPVPGGGAEFEHGAWFVSMNGGPERRVFEAHVEDADTPDFRHRIVVATWLTDEYNRRVADRRTSDGRDAPDGERRGGADRRTWLVGRVRPKTME